MPIAPAIGTLWEPRKSDIASPIPVVRSFRTQKTAVISGTLVKATRARVSLTRSPYGVRRSTTTPWRTILVGAPVHLRSHGDCYPGRTRSPVLGTGAQPPRGAPARSSATGPGLPERAHQRARPAGGNSDRRPHTVRSASVGVSLPPRLAVQ